MRERILAALQYACLGAGALLVSMVALARLDGEVGRQTAIESFEAAARAPDQSLWSPERVKDYEASLAIVKDVPLAILSGGRFDLGVGAGYLPSNYAAFGQTLRRRGALMEEGLSLLRRAWSGYALAAYVDGLQSAGRIDEALALTEESVAAARTSGSPYWLTYALWIAGMAFAHTDRRRALAAWDEGIAVVREHRVHFFEGFLARDAARVHTSDGEPDVALLLFSEAIDAFHRSGNVPQLVITVASVPALFEKLERFEAAATLFGAMSRQPSSSHHVPELADMERRLTAALGEARVSELIALGAAFDLDGAAVYAREQIAVARREPTAATRPSRPAGLSRREVEVIRLGRFAREPAR